MNDIRPVLVGVDASDSARDAAEWAIDLAALWGAPLDMVHVVPGALDESPITPVPGWMVELGDAAARAGVEPRAIEVVPGGAVELLANRAAASRILGNQDRLGRHFVGDARQDAELERCAQHR